MTSQILSFIRKMAPAPPTPSPLQPRSHVFCLHSLGHLLSLTATPASSQTQGPTQSFSEILTMAVATRLSPSLPACEFPEGGVSPCPQLP